MHEMSLAESILQTIEDVAGAGWCMACAKSVAMTEVFAGCPHCGGFQLHVTAGTDIRIKELEVS